MHSDKDIKLQGQKEMMISVGEVDVGMEVMEEVLGVELEVMVVVEGEGEENKDDGWVRNKLRNGFLQQVCAFESPNP